MTKDRVIIKQFLMTDRPDDNYESDDEYNRYVNVYKDYSIILESDPNYDRDADTFDEAFRKAVDMSMEHGLNILDIAFYDTDSECFVDMPEKLSGWGGRTKEEDFQNRVDAFKYYMVGMVRTIEETLREYDEDVCLDRLADDVEYFTFDEENAYQNDWEDERLKKDIEKMSDMIRDVISSE